jgi:hypothetical protein
MKSSIFWDITPYIQLKIIGYWEGSRRFHLHGRRINQTKPSACYLFRGGFLFGLFFDPEDVGDVFLLNVC